MDNVGAILSRAETDQERLAAILRIVVFLALLATVLSLRQQGAHHHPVLAVTLAYGGLALTGLLLAWRGIFHALMPYVFVTLEVGLLLMQTVFMSSLMGRSPSVLTTVPMATIIFVFLAHAAMRYRPWLVVYTAALFLSGVFMAVAIMPDYEAGMGTGHAGEHNFMHHQVVPFTVLILTALILFVTGRGTRRLLRASVEERIGRARLSRFFAPDIAEQLLSGRETEVGTGRVRPVVVLFADIRGFSSLAENMEPGELSMFLAEFREVLATTIRDHGGIVDKFIGDAVMAVFGFPDYGNSPSDRALKCALAMRDRIARWSKQRKRAGLAAVEVGIGLHAGDAFVGVIGKESLLEFTVIGDTVNVAERIERLTRTLNADIAVSEQAARRAAEIPGAGWILTKSCRLAGRSQPLDVLYLPRDKRHSGEGERMRPREETTVQATDVFWSAPR